ncbi:MAG TPA: radical SAM protein [bacterium]
MPRIKRITLIEPEPAGFHVFSRFSMPRLGLPLLGAILQRRGYDVRIHIGACKPKDFQSYAESDLIGLSTTTSTAPEAYRLADIFRKMGKLVLIGGVHATFVPEDALRHADYVLRGEAEDGFPQLLDCLEGRGNLADVLGLSYRRGEAIVHNADPPFITDLDRLPFPDFSLMVSKTKLFDIPIQASRGCPFPCNFCSVTKMFGRKVRFRSVESVIAELRQIPKPSVFFYDDNFCARPEFTRSLLEAMLRQGIKLNYFSAQVRADITRDLEIMKLFHAAGGRQVYVGFESVNPESLKAYDKRQSLDEIASSMEVFRSFKIHVHGMFVIGSDFDTRRTARETLHLARQTGMDTVQFMMLTPLPGTEMYRDLEQQDRILTRDWGLYDAHHAVFLPQRMTPLQLQKSAISGMARFYSSRRFISGLAQGNLYKASRAAMGLYIIRRWKWANRHWTTELRRLSLQARRARLEKQLRELSGQLEDTLSRIPTRLENVRQQVEQLSRQIEQLAQQRLAAVEKDLLLLEARVQKLADEVLSLLNQIPPLAPR